MTAEIFLWINAVLYTVFAAWCVLQPSATATFSGLSFLNTSGRSEYFALYVGLEAAWAVMYVICAINPELHYAGIFYSVFLYSGVVLGRWISIFQKGISSNNTYVIAILEIILGAWAVFLIMQY